MIEAIDKNFHKESNEKNFFKIGPEIKKLIFKVWPLFDPHWFANHKRYGKSIDTFSCKNFIRNTNKNELSKFDNKQTFYSHFDYTPFLAPNFKTVNAIPTFL